MHRYFKYQSPNAVRPTLKTGRLRWSRPSKFNDLFDMSEPFSTDFNGELVVSRALELMWERLVTPGHRPPMNKMGVVLELSRVPFLVMGQQKFKSHMRPGVEASLAKLPSILEAFGEQIVDHLSKIKVLCLSSVNDDNGMWGLYASDNQGAVLEFANMPGLDSVYQLAKPIEYADQAPPLLDDEGFAELLAGNRRLRADLIDPLMYFKTTRWRDERELRLVSGDGRFPDQEVEDVAFHPRELVGVYFGVRAEELRAELEPLVRQKYPDAKVWQAIKCKGMKIDFRLIDDTY